MGRFRRILFFLAIFHLFVACRGGANQGVDLVGGSLIEWQENSYLQFTFSVNRGEVLKYELLASEDARFFEVNSTTGELTSTVAVDFETPLDQDKDGVFKLVLRVLDAESSIKDFDVSIKVLDLKEYQLKIDFPLDQSNLGGRDSVVLRGDLIENGEGVPIAPNNIEVTVNGIPATPFSNQSSQWRAELALPLGESTVNVQARWAGDAQTDSSLTLLNEPIENKLSGFSMDGIGVYYISINKQSILYKQDDSARSETLLTLSSNDDERACIKLLHVVSQAASGDLFVVCELASEHAQGLFRYQKGSAELVFIDSVFSSNLVVLPKQLSSQHLLYLTGQNELTLYQMDLGDRIPLPLVNLSEPGRFVAADYYMNNIYSVWEYQNNYYFFSLNGGGIMPGSEGSSPVAREWTNIGGMSTSLFEGLGALENIWVFEDRFFLQFNGGVKSCNRVLGDCSQFEVFDALFDASILQNTARLDNLIYFKRPTSGAILQLNLLENTLLQLVQGENINAFLSPDLDEEAHTLYGFNANNLSLRKFDMASWVEGEQQTFDDSLVIGEALSVRLDSANEYIYLTANDSWVGDFSSGAANIVILTRADHSISPILSNEMFLSLLGKNDTDVRVRIGAAVPNENKEAIWFSAAVTYENSLALRKGIYSYNLLSGALTILREWFVDSWKDQQRVLIEPDEMSFFYPEINSYVISSWSEGKLGLMDPSGTYTQLLPPNAPFGLTYNGILDAPRNRLLFASIIYDQEKPVLPPRLTFFDLNSYVWEYFSPTSSTVIPPLSTDFTFSQAKQLIYYYANSGIVVTDMVTGESAFKGL